MSSIWLHSVRSTHLVRVWMNLSIYVLIIASGRSICEQREEGKKEDLVISLI